MSILEKFWGGVCAVGVAAVATVTLPVSLTVATVGGLASGEGWEGVKERVEELTDDIDEVLDSAYGFGNRHAGTMTRVTVSAGFAFIGAAVDIGDVTSVGDVTSAAPGGASFGALDSAPDISSGGDVQFGEGRWEGTDQWGNIVSESPGSPPAYENPGSAPYPAPDPVDITWKS